MSVATNFETFCNNLLISQDIRSTISTRYTAICKRLNKDFWDMDTDHGGRYFGSYGRNTANGWVSDIDILFEMPLATYRQYDAYNGNGQSALLQAVKNSIATTYSDTKLKGDGQIVQVNFSDKMQLEVLPVFRINQEEKYTYANANDGGSWNKTNPIPEIQAISKGDKETNGNLRPLCRMARAWKFRNLVPMSGILIDTLANRFLVNWQHKNMSYLYYDWMSRDFFEYLKNQPATQTIWSAIGSGQTINNPDNFRYKATMAYNNALKAIEEEKKGYHYTSKATWREIYGTRFPE